MCSLPHNLLLCGAADPNHDLCTLGKHSTMGLRCQTNSFI